MEIIGGVYKIYVGMLTPLILIALCICMGVLQKVKGWKVGSWLQVAVVVVWMVFQFLGGVLIGMNRQASMHSPSAIGQRVEVSPEEKLLFHYVCPAIGTGLLFLLVARLPSRKGPEKRFTSDGSISSRGATDSAEFSALARKALLTAFPEFAPYYREMEDGAFFEIRFPHPAVPLELLVTTRDHDISIFFDETHRHIGMGQNLPPEVQVEQAVAYLRSLFDGTMLLVRDLRWEGYDFCDVPEIWKDDPEKNLVFTTWRGLGSAA